MIYHLINLSKLLLQNGHINISCFSPGNKNFGLKNLSPFHSPVHICFVHEPPVTKPYMRKYSQRSHAKAYSKQWEEDNKERRTQYKRDLHQYQCSWGGNPRNQNCLIKIDPTLFN